MSDKTLIVITGPTAIGKTSLAITIARFFNTEIVSCDSRQFFKEMQIGTAKPSQEELNQVKHHFINSHSISDKFSVGDFEKQGIEVIQNIFLAHDIAVLVGGSGLYIKAITTGFDELPQSDPKIREDLNSLYQNEGITALQQKLKQVDPNYFLEVDLNNPQRVIRALEVSISSGLPFSSYHSNNHKTRPFNIIKIGLNTARDLLYRRINFRVDQMLKDGLIEEVKSLILYRHLNALNTVGYSEIFEFLDDKISLNQAVEKLKQNTRRFAKRQLTWFRKDEEIKWFEPEESYAIIEYLDKTL